MDLSPQTSQKESSICCMSVCSPLDTVGVSKVMSLSSFFIVKQDNNRGNEVDNLSSWKKINIRSAVSATVTIPAGSQGGTWETPRDPGFRLHHLERLNCSMEMTHFSSRCWSRKSQHPLQYLLLWTSHHFINFSILWTKFNLSGVKCDVKYPANTKTLCCGVNINQMKCCSTENSP